jgi:hypothetical protein
MKMKMREGVDCRDESGVFCFNSEFGLISDDDDFELALVVIVCVIRPACFFCIQKDIYNCNRPGHI